MAIVKTWFGEIELQDDDVIGSKVLKADVPVIVERLQQEKFSVFDKSCRGRFRELSINLGLVKSEREYLALLRTVAIQLGKAQLATAFARPDARIIQLIDGVDDIDEAINLLSERLLAWEIVETEIFETSMQELGSEPATRPLLKQELKGPIERLGNLRERLAGVIQLEMREIAPNLSLLAGELLGARLMARAGSLESLARMPSSKIQVMGASKALFKHLQFGAKPPKHGIIFQHPLVRGSAPDKRGKIARTIAAKIAIAARLDFYSKRAYPELFAQLQQRTENLGKPGTKDLL
jgi:nucleolar protein 56